ncbi:hypothetical protein QBC35DRAFT_453942 [Podospora australis]|uniref:Apple domain-containing protein n=1 Tax=Podospora australis TaxID=1536484 RepID=A0AAN6WPM1_9PEZI|nr:hypothetical protein QBC35DRAFT_453942 [Podospora australis]
MDRRTPTSPRSVHTGGSSSRNVAYHDGLIPTEHQAGSIRQSANYPEVMPSGRETPEKSYPEVATSPPLEKNYPEVATTEHHLYRGQQRQQQQQNGHPSPVPTPSHTPAPTVPTPAPTIPLGQQAGYPRPSGVHSLGDAWSEAGDDIERETRNFPYHPPEKRSSRPLWKRKTFWIIWALVGVIIALAAVVGAMASGKIKTDSSSPAAEDPNTPSSLTLSISTALSGQTITLSCPSANNLEYTYTPPSGQEKVFRRKCGVNFSGGDGSLGKVNGDNSIVSLTDCLDRCAKEAKCVGAVWNPRADPNPECWLKEFMGVGSSQDGLEAGVLTQ